MEKEEYLIVENHVITKAVEPLTDRTGWMTFLAYLYIISGVLTCLTIIGAVIGWIPIWAGYVLLKSVKGFKHASGTGRKKYLRYANMKLCTFFTIIGVFTLITFCLYVFGFIVKLVV